MLLENYLFGAGAFCVGALKAGLTPQPGRRSTMLPWVRELVRKVCVPPQNWQRLPRMTWRQKRERLIYERTRGTCRNHTFASDDNTVLKYVNATRLHVLLLNSCHAGIVAITVPCESVDFDTTRLVPLAKSDIH